MMSEVWKIGDQDEGFDGVPFIEIYAGEEGTSSFEPICRVEPGMDDAETFTLDERHTARARLICAAPDLLAAAKEFVRKVDAGEAKSTKSYAAFKAAISRAEGGE